MPRCDRRAGVALVLASLVTFGCGREPGRNGPQAPPDSTLGLRQRITALEAARSFGAGELRERTRHPDPRVRRAAAVALGRIQDSAALPDLLPLLDDPDSAVAVQAAWSLGQLQGLTESERYALQAPLVARVDGHPEPQLGPFVEALAKQGGPEVLPILEQSLASGVLADLGSEARDPFLEGVAALGIARQRSASARELLALLGDLTNRAPAAAWRIAAAMAADPDTAFYAPLVSLLAHPASEVRAAGARALGKLGDRRAFRPLTHGLADLDWEVRATILLALGELADPGAPDRELREFCASLCGDQHPLVREAAVAALDSAGVGPHTASLRERLADEAPAVRLAALRALARWEPSATRAAWNAARQDSADFVRSGALETARAILGEPAGLDTLLAALVGPARRDRAAAAEALGKPPVARADRARVRSALEHALGDPDFVVVATAAAALGALGDPAALPALERAYESHGVTHEDVDVRLAVAEAARDLARPGGRREFLRRLQSDADSRVAHAGAVGLAKIDGLPAPAPPRPQARDLPLDTDSLPPVDLGTVAVKLVTRHGVAILELDGDRTPRTTAHFLRLVDSGFYADGVFHRVVPAFVVQGGCPRGDGWGDSGEWIPCEYSDRRYDAPGIVGMAHAGRDTGGSQFFITHLPVPRLDGRYTAFGRVRDGMDVVDRIVRGDRFRIERLPSPPP